MEKEEYARWDQKKKKTKNNTLLNFKTRLNWLTARVLQSGMTRKRLNYHIVMVVKNCRLNFKLLDSFHFHFQMYIYSYKCQRCKRESNKNAKDAKKNVRLVKNVIYNELKKFQQLVNLHSSCIRGAMWYANGTVTVSS